mmetsp:Transcript_57436/g.101960  ORF Transcript_57436/g.101960 Transcript_57436/m.101960 type:complete len:873 (-) Transcript_57436:105-2723(-)|eukprot:CAMPEP_0197644904 /NCGR_PEP_ID=MMETSP1338-20131121/17731_1 /TAXON_ID=43686 ORGANISM="Pelagodinium beii, Strain RCC1491" /NCGR_SAMPLE_ID=MMETSP1338 /ASSEMBLY_ACC=CAM_ASM_000754 /LENGTH=872 /DNA_ID=CAMNT_0043218381 /DNA_START=64 /DNA_END=2682 /DNA_ORIENTATION=-
MGNIVGAVCVPERLPLEVPVLQTSRKQAKPEIGDNAIIEYFTDIEGNWEYFLRFVVRSQILTWDEEEGDQGCWGPGTLRLKSNGILVFGGDATDKGPGDIRIVKTLTKLKQDNMKRVFIVLGNRDLQKLRFPAELLYVGRPEDIYLSPHDQRAKPFHEWCEEMKLKPDLVSKCKWMLHCTMGCQDTTFNTRKTELAMIHGKATDNDVVNSYVQSVDPKDSDPWMLAFLALGQIGLVLQDTLFVHGGVHDGCIETAISLQNWVENLNDWKDEQLLQFCMNPYFVTVDDAKIRAGEDLILYGTPTKKDISVIYHNPFEDGNPHLRSQQVEDYLTRWGVKRLLSGHQPHGQSPTVVRHPNTGLLCVTADTSRSDGTAEKLPGLNPADNRGVVVSVVRIVGPHLEIEGVLHSGLKHKCSLHTDPIKDELPDALVGRQLVNGAWMKTVLEEKDGDEPLLHCALGKGFSIKVDNEPMHKCCMRLKEQFKFDAAAPYAMSEIRSSSRRTQTPTIELDTFQTADLSVHEATLSASSRDFTFESEQFHQAECYIFGFSGLFLNVKSQIASEIVKKVNGLIEKGKRVIFVTNNSNKSRETLAAELTHTHRLRLSASRELEMAAASLVSIEQDGSPNAKETNDFIIGNSVISSARTCGWFLKQRGICKPFVICGSEALLDEMESFGITDYFSTFDKKTGKTRPQFNDPLSKESVMSIIQKNPTVDAVVVGWDFSFNVTKVGVAVQYLKWNEQIPLISCSLDPSGILGHAKDSQGGEQKMFHVGNGSMTQCISECTGREAISVGKPSDVLLEQLRHSHADGGYNIDSSKTVVVGSTLETDIKMANMGSMKSLLVFTGVASREDVKRVTDPLLMPTWVLDSFADA